MINPGEMKLIKKLVEEAIITSITTKNEILVNFSGSVNSISVYRITEDNEIESMCDETIYLSGMLKKNTTQQLEEVIKKVKEFKEANNEVKNQ